MGPAAAPAARSFGYLAFSAEQKRKKRSTLVADRFLLTAPSLMLVTILSWIIVGSIAAWFLNTVSGAGNLGVQIDWLAGVLGALAGGLLLALVLRRPADQLDWWAGIPVAFLAGLAVCSFLGCSPVHATRLDIRRFTVAQLRAVPLAGWLALGALAGASRVAFVNATPINWDAVQFDLALSHFDLHAHQPHPPGYILYVLAGRAINLFVGNPTQALSLLSVLCSALAVSLLWWLTFHIFGEESIGLGAAILLLASPLALYYGAAGLTYAPEMLLSIVVAAVAWRVRPEPSGGMSGLLLGLALGVAGGVRQTSLVVLLPICVWALWRGDKQSEDNVLSHVACNMRCVARAAGHHVGRPWRVPA